MATMTKRPRKGANKRTAEFPAVTPEPELLREPTPDPAVPAAARIGDVVALEGHAGRWRVYAQGAHRLRVGEDGKPRSESEVVERKRVLRILERPERRASKPRSSRPKVPALVLPAVGADPVILCNVVETWVLRHPEADRENLLEAIVQNLAKRGM